MLPQFSIHGGWRVPNKVFIVLSILVVVLTWTLLIVVYPALPQTIPAHFNFHGLPDASAAKSWGTVFFLGIIQIVLVALTWWLSYHPQYSNLPTTVTLKLIPEPIQSVIKAILAHMIVMTGLVASLIMAYLSLGMIQISLGLATKINSLAIFGLTGLLLFIIIVYTVWLVKLTKHLEIKNNPRQ